MTWLPARARAELLQTAVLYGGLLLADAVAVVRRHRAEPSPLPTTDDEESPREDVPQ